MSRFPESPPGMPLLAGMLSSCVAGKEEARLLGPLRKMESRQRAFDSLPLNVIAEVVSWVKEPTDARSLLRTSKLLLAQSKEASVQAAWLSRHSPRRVLTYGNDRWVFNWSEPLVLRLLQEDGPGGAAILANFLKDAGNNLCKASQKKHVLLDAGAAVDKADEGGQTPLLIASLWGHKDIAAMLLDAGADVDKPINFLVGGTTPLYRACQNGHKEVAQLLLERGATLDAANEVEQTPMFIACEEGHKEIVQLLLDAGVDVDDANDDGDTALLIAAQIGHKDVVQLLLDKGADPNKGDQTPLLVASEAGHKDIVEMLERASS
ncbi:ankyrin repeat-containing domain protein [Dunaliella salina]|uniref:Ankyrin repeat-containing domain protein n=1 Tax=Dunaliella salina TaxID=3046 RepID=A0ABQ7GFU5_DUNSA|nr:ankyrin repeat-containing domain protein [Dunaliella salina]|eukprot:KAF5833477.1 ankyrin repeat-containing domain protein [Dunaliella salina]